VVAVLACLLAVLVLAVGGVFLFEGVAANFFRLAVFFAVLTAVLLVANVIAQGTDAYRAPTGKEVGKDLVTALWGVGFGVPLIFISLNGNATPLEEWRDPLLVLLVGLVFPAVRPRGVTVPQAQP
jgi:hypothetical protein